MTYSKKYIAICIHCRTPLNCVSNVHSKCKYFSIFCKTTLRLKNDLVNRVASTLSSYIIFLAKKLDKPCTNKYDRTCVCSEQEEQ